MKGGADKKLQTKATMIISTATERFGAVEKRSTKSQYSKNHRAEKISWLRQEQRLLKMQFRGQMRTRSQGWQNYVVSLGRNCRPSAEQGGTGAV